MFSKFLDLRGLENFEGVLWDSLTFPWQVKRKGGCRDGADCPNCHECFWTKVGWRCWDFNVGQLAIHFWDFRCGKKRVWDFTVELQQRRRFQLLEMESLQFLKSTTRNLSKNRRWILYFKILLICEANETFGNSTTKCLEKLDCQSRGLDGLSSAEATGNG